MTNRFDASKLQTIAECREAAQNLEAACRKMDKAIADYRNACVEWYWWGYHSVPLPSDVTDERNRLLRTIQQRIGELALSEN